jgi:hypothetical protein
MRYWCQPSGGCLSQFQSKLEAALAYAARGFPVFPVVARGKEPAVDRWREEATTDPETIRSWWGEFPEDNIGIACGPAPAPWVLDCDDHSAVARVDALFQEHGGLAERPLVSRTAKGLHLLFAGRDDLRNTIKRLPGVDTRGTGGYIVAPPSVHPSGHVYEWAYYSDAPLHAPPEYLADLFRSRAMPQRREHDLPNRTEVVTRVILQEYVNSTKNEQLRDAAQRILDGVSWSPKGQRDGVMHSLVGSLGVFIADKYDADIDPSDLSVFRASLQAVTEEGVNRATDEQWLAGKFAASDARPFHADLKAEQKEQAKQAREELDEMIATAPQGPLEISFTLQDFVMVRQAVEALSRDRAIYHRARKLVTISTDDSHPDAGPQIHELKDPTIAEKLSQVAVFIMYDDDGRKTIAIPPKTVAQVSSRGEWPGVRPLAGFVPAPTLRADGTLLAKEGYDPTSRLYLVRTVPVFVPDAPTKDEAIAARNFLLELVCDFPFTSDADRAVWLSLVLTRACRLAVNGPTPVFAFDAPTPGSGKSLLAELACAIALGKKQRTTAWPRNNGDDEIAKMLLAAALQGHDCMFFDNVKSAFGGGPLEMVITSAGISGRILGSTEMAEAPFAVTWIATGNNLRVADDMLRRTLWCRVDPNRPDPENRTGFKYPNVMEHVLANHERYLSAALTLLRAFIVAGKPSTARRLGSFEAWAETIAGAVVWVGLPDPVTTQARQKSEAPDDEGAARAAVVQAIFTLQEGGKSEVYIRDLVTADVYQGFREAVESWTTGKGPGGSLTAQQVGELLKRARGKVMGVAGRQLKLTGRTDRMGATVWGVEDCDRKAA